MSEPRATGLRTAAFVLAASAIPVPVLAGTLTLEGMAKPTVALAESEQLLVRFRRGGERLRLHAGGGHRDLRDLFQEAGVPPWQRSRIPIVLDGNARVLAIGDLWISDLGRAEFARLGRDLHWNR